MRKILWAVDPFAKDKAVVRSAAGSLSALAKSDPAEVYPVYVWPAAQSGVDFPRVQERLDELEVQGRDALTRALGRAKVAGMKPLIVLPGASLTTRGQVQELVLYAKEMGAQMIVLSTRGHTGLKRWVMGSFAETLALYSDLPLMVVHPNWKRVPEFRKILFPTDFSDASHSAFGRVVEFARARRTQIVLFHKAPTMGYPPFEWGAYYYATYEKVRQEDLTAARKKAASWAKYALEREVRIEIVIDRSPAGDLAEAILKRSKKLGGMIALASQSGPMTSTLLGSVARTVLRHSLQPVWVIHPRPAELKAQSEAVQVVRRLAPQSESRSNLLS